MILKRNTVTNRGYRVKHPSLFNALYCTNINVVLVPLRINGCINTRNEVKQILTPKCSI